MSIENEFTNEEMTEKVISESRSAEATFSVTFKRPVEYNGKKYTEITFDFEKLTGKDALEIENELTAQGKPLVIPAFSGDYLTRMAAKAADSPIGYDFFDIVSLRDFNAIRSAARSFLLQSE